MTMLDAPSAVAASICWLARWRGEGREYAVSATDRHPRPCDWCIYPPERLIEMVEEFNEEDLIRDGHGALRVDATDQPLHRLAGNFHHLPRREQRELVDRALYSEAVPA